jgi:hypothetical protein
VIATDGFSRAGDGGGATYRRVTVAPTHRGWFRSPDGSIWELDEDRVSIRAMGAVGDGRADDRAAVQGAIDYIAARGGGIVVIPPGRFRLVMVAAPDHTGPICLWLRSTVEVRGVDRRRSILTLADGQRGPGTFGRIVASGDLHDVALANFTLEANRAGQLAERDATNGGAIMLGTAGTHVERVTIEDVIVKDANGQGIQVVGYPGRPSRNVTIRNNAIYHSSFIGIQVSHFRDILIEGNAIEDCRDNAIDLYGDNFLDNSNTVTSCFARVRQNTVTNCACGVFLETVSDIDVTDNIFRQCRVTGLHINRIHGEPGGIMIMGNRTTDTPIGASMTGDFGGVSFLNNHIGKFSIAGLQFGLDGQGNVSNVVASGNVFDCRNISAPIVYGCAPDGVLSWIRVTDNFVYGLPDQGKLFVNKFKTNNDVNVERFIGVQKRLF